MSDCRRNAKSGCCRHLIQNYGLDQSQPWKECAKTGLLSCSDTTDCFSSTPLTPPPAPRDRQLPLALLLFRSPTDCRGLHSVVVLVLVMRSVVMAVVTGEEGGACPVTRPVSLLSADRAASQSAAAIQSASQPPPSSHPVSRRHPVSRHPVIQSAAIQSAASRHPVSQSAASRHPVSRHPVSQSAAI